MRLQVDVHEVDDTGAESPGDLFILEGKKA